MPVFRFDKTCGIARSIKTFLNPEGGTTRSAVADVERHEDTVENSKKASRSAPEHNTKTTSNEEELHHKRQELARITQDIRAAKNRAERFERVKRAKRAQHDVFQLERETGDTGALPDFVVIGAAKAGTTFFYHLLAKHPHVEPAAMKEPHFFNLLYDEGIEWYRQCFPTPKWSDGRRTITGEATPEYIFHPRVPERMVEVLPQARLIALLRNPIDWIYSSYYHQVRTGTETRSFEEAIEAYFRDPLHKRLSKSIWVEHLKRWSRFYSDEQMLVLKSEDFFERPVETLKVALRFLELPEWEPEASDLSDKRNKGDYGQGMNPAIKHRLEEYFEPHNKRLYDYLGVDLGW